MSNFENYDIAILSMYLQRDQLSLACENCLSSSSDARGCTLDHSVVLGLLHCLPVQHFTGLARQVAAAVVQSAALVASHLQQRPGLELSLAALLSSLPVVSAAAAAGGPAAEASVDAAAEASVDAAAEASSSAPAAGTARLTLSKPPPDSGLPRFLAA